MRIKLPRRCEVPQAFGRTLATAAMLSMALLAGQSPALAQQGNKPTMVQKVMPTKVAPNAKARSDQALKNRSRDDVTVPEGVGDEPVGPAVPNPSSYPDPSLQLENGGGDGGDTNSESSLESAGPPSKLELLEAFGVDELSDPLVVNGINSGSNPPDTVGDIGPNHYVQMTNPGTFRVFDRNGVPTPAGSTSFGSLWPNDPGVADPDPCTVDRGDPIVVYDHLADRWLLMQFSWAQNDVNNNPVAPFFLCFAVSQGPAPTPETGANTWYLYTINTGTVFPDYPKVGVWNDAWYMTTYEGSNLGVFALDRANMLNGNAANMIKFTISSLPANAGVRDTRILPADLNGAQPPAGTPGLFLRTVDNTQDTGDADDRIEIFELVSNWADPGSSTFTNVQDLRGGDGLIDFFLLTCDRNSTGATNAFRDCVPTPGGGTADALSNRPMMQLGYRNFGGYEVMTVNQTVDVRPALNALGVGFPWAPVVNEVAGVRWYELRRNEGDLDWDLFQQGTYAAQSNPADEGEVLHRWMGSGSMDRFGNMAIGYSVSSDDVVNPGIRYAGRIPTDPLGLLPQSEFSITEGTTAPGGTGTRWGDYSAMSVDPVDDCTFWYTTHLSSSEAGSRTRIGRFRFSGCAADLEVVKWATPSPAIAGEQITYTITVANHGPLDATAIVVTDTLPAGFSYVASSLAGDCSAVGQVVTCTLDDLAVGDEASFTITAQIGSGVLVPGGPQSFSNLVAVAGAEGDTDETNNSFSLATLVNESADLEVTKTCKPDDTQAAGDQAFCEITVKNWGPSDARNVVLTDDISSDGSYSIDAIATTQGACAAASGDVSCSLGTIAAGASVKVRVDFTSADGVDVNDTATATSATPDPDTGNNTATGRVSFDARADLSLEKMADVLTAIPGEQLVYTLTVTNNGPSTADNVVVQDVVPAGLQIISVSGTGGATCVSGVPGNAALPSSCNFGSLAPTVSGVMTITTLVLEDTVGTLVNNGTTSSDTDDPDNSDNNATVSVPVLPTADIQVSKTATKDPVTAGDVFAYLVDVHNAGPSDAVAVSLTDTLPAEVDLISFNANKGGVCANPLQGIVTCNWASIAAGDTATVTINVQVKADTPDGTPLSNSVTADSATHDPDETNNSFVLDTDVEVGADLWMEKTGNFPANNPSGTIIYRLTVHNEDGCTAEVPTNCGTGGPSDAQNVLVIDQLPLNPKKIIFEFATEGCTYSSATHQVTCQFGAVPYGTSVFADIQVRAKGSVGEIVNTATVSSTTPDANNANNTHSLKMTVGGGLGDTGGSGGGRGKSPKG